MQNTIINTYCKTVTFKIFKEIKSKKQKKIRDFQNNHTNLKKSQLEFLNTKKNNIIKIQNSAWFKEMSITTEKIINTLEVVSKRLSRMQHTETKG